MELLTNPTTWMFVALLVLAGIWAEIRYRMGGSAALLSNELQDLIEEIKYKGEVNGARSIVQTLMSQGLLKREEDGTFVGMDGKTFNAEQYLRSKVSPEEMKSLEDEHKKYMTKN